MKAAYKPPTNSQLKAKYQLGIFRAIQLTFTTTALFLLDNGICEKETILQLWNKLYASAEQMLEDGLDLDEMQDTLKKEYDIEIQWR